MSEHDFYADPTVFDQWQASAAGWFRAHTGKFVPYGWVIGFAALGILMFGIAAGVAVVTLSRAGEGAPLWNQSLASGITVVTGLAAAQLLWCQALQAWPGDITMPRVLRCLGGYVGWTAPVKKSGSRIKRAAYAVGALPERRKSSQRQRESVQVFFTAVRAAGVNVAIARALFNAGIRSPRQLLRADDEQLLAIRGVGPATIRKLRTHFQTSH